MLVENYFLLYELFVFLFSLGSKFIFLEEFIIGGNGLAKVLWFSPYYF